MIENQDPVDAPKERDPEDVVATKRSASSMRGMALTGGRWVALEGIVIQGLQVVSTMVLARLLTPDDFGIVAVVSLVLVLFAILTNIGFSASVVRRETVNRRYLSSMFWASSSVGLAATIGAALLAPLFSTMAGNPSASPYLVVASVTIFFGMVKSVPRALLLRDFRFRDISAAVVLGFVAYIAIAITLAATTDLGAWAIVLGRVANSAIMLGTQWFMSRFVPLLQLRRADVREDLGFNFAFLGMRGSQYLSKNIDYWYVGWALGPTALGTYYIAYVLPNLLRRRMTTAVSGPLFVTVTGFATDRDRVRRAYLNATKFISLGAYPVLIGMALVSDEMIRVAFGRQWLAAIEPMAILAIAAAVNVIGPVGSGILTAVGKPIRNVVVNLTWSGMIVIGLAVVTTNGSLTYVAFVILVTTVLALVLQVALLRGPIDLHWGSVLQSIWPATASTMVMAVTVAGTRMLMGDLGGVVVRLVVLVAAGAIAYVGFGFLAFRKTFTKARGDVRTVFVKT